jgi:hypothetical protein
VTALWAIYRGQELLGGVLAVDELDALRTWARAQGIVAERDGDVLTVPDEHFATVEHLRATRIAGSA